MNIEILLVTYGEPPRALFFDQWGYSKKILYKLTKLVAPIPGWSIPLIAAWRGWGRKRLWGKENYCSPLEQVTNQQAQKLADTLSQKYPDNTWNVHVAYEFRNPSLVDYLQKMEEKPCDWLFIVPMYVPTSDFTNGISRRDYAMYAKQACCGIPRPHFFTFRPHLDDLAEMMACFVKRKLAEMGCPQEQWQETGLLLGCHGTVVKPPPGITDSGYQDTFDLYQKLEKLLTPFFKKVDIGWLNHRLGGDWTRPTLEEAAKAMQQEGVQQFAYYPFGFLADNAETELEGKMVLRDLGIVTYYHLPAVNDDEEFIALLSILLQEWIEGTKKEGSKDEQ